MGTRQSYPAGMPCWVDVAVDDVAGATAFYSDLFGWTADVSEAPGDMRYTNFRQDGRTVAGLGSKMGPQPDAWSVYVATDDAAATLDAVGAAGGQVLVGPIEVPGVGTFGVFTDPNGAPCGAWAASAHIGAELVNEPVAFAWSELATPDVDVTVGFYSEVFGWRTADGTAGGAVFTDADGRAFCGAHGAGPGEPPFWSVWFAVQDCDAVVARVEELGGSVLSAPSDMGFGRGAVVAAPGGAAFGVASLDAADD